MSELKASLAEIQGQVKSYKTYSDDLAKEYVELLKSTCQLLKDNQSDELGRRLKKRLDEGVKALHVEVNDRFDPYFYSMRDKKKQDELNYSKLVVTGVLRKIIRLL